MFGKFLLHQKFRLEKSPWEHFFAGMSPLEMIDEKDSLDSKLPKNDATVKIIDVTRRISYN